MAALARGQSGVVTRAQLLGLGLGAAAIKERTKRGLLRPVHRGVYVLGGSGPTAERRRTAAVLACGPGTVLSHRSAAWLWGIFPYDPGRVEVSRRGARQTKHRGILLRQARLRADEVEEVDGIPITAVFRTVFDLAAIASPREVERAFHEAEVKQLTAQVSLLELLRRHPKRRGAATVRALLGGREPAGITQTDLEELFVAFLDGHGFPRPLLNATLPIRGRLLKPDCMWPEHRLLFELDGREVHLTDQAFEGDRARDRVLLAEGWRSTRVTWRQLQTEPEQIAADLRELLRAKTAPPTL
jgi:predicted transcriptional regulator of viral defense system